MDLGKCHVIFYLKRNGEKEIQVKGVWEEEEIYIQ